MPFPLSEAELMKTEEELGARLPESYRDAMMKINGGSVEAYDEVWDLFPIRDQSSKKLISHTCNHVLRETESAREWPNFHEGALAIGENGAGDYLIMFQEGRTFEPEIYAWFHEDGALVTVAGHFAELQRA